VPLTTSQHAERVHYGVRMNQIIRELKRQFAGERLEPEQLKGLIRDRRPIGIHITADGFRTARVGATWCPDSRRAFERPKAQ
jgi:hypothetical protein